VSKRSERTVGTTGERSQRTIGGAVERSERTVGSAGGRSEPTVDRDLDHDDAGRATAGDGDEGRVTGRPGAVRERRQVDPDRLAELEAERSFLLRSLGDLEAEWSVGDLDEADYVTLRDGYTKRTADVLRQIDEGLARLPTRPPTLWGRRLVAVVGVVAVAVLAGFLVARSSGQRSPGQQLSGDAPGDDVAVTLSEARSLLGTDPRRAIELYSDVIEQRPGQPEAHTYRGWLLYINSRGAGERVRAQADELAEADLAAAIDADSRYADPHCFRAVIAANAGDEAMAGEEADQCLALDPPGEVRALMAEADLTADLPTTPDTSPE